MGGLPCRPPITLKVAADLSPLHAAAHNAKAKESSARGNPENHQIRVYPPETALIPEAGRVVPSVIHKRAVQSLALNESPKITAPRTLTHRIPGEKPGPILHLQPLQRRKKCAPAFAGNAVSFHESARQIGTSFPVRRSGRAGSHRDFADRALGQPEDAVLRHRQA